MENGVMRELNTRKKNTPKQAEPIGNREYMAALTRLAGGKVRCTYCYGSGNPCRWCQPVVDLFDCPGDTGDNGDKIAESVENDTTVAAVTAPHDSAHE